MLRKLQISVPFWINYILTVFIIYSLCVLKRYKQTKTNITQKLASSAFCKYLYLTSCYHKVKISGSVFTLFWPVSRFSGSVFILLLSVSTKRSGEGYSDYIEKKNQRVYSSSETSTKKLKN